MDRQPDHLAELRHRRLAAIALPVGVGGEADRRVPRQMRRQRREVQRIERQHVLQPQDRIGQQHAGEVEQQHMDAVAAPALLSLGIDSGQGVKAALHGSEHRMEPGAPALHYREQAHSHGLRHRDDERGEDQNEQPTLRGHDVSSFRTVRGGRAPRRDRRAGQERSGRRARDRVSSGWPHALSQRRK